MVIVFKKHISIFIIVLMTVSVFSQKHLSSSVSLSKNSVYVGEPVQVTVSVFTSTWFTKGVNPGNIKVNGAFTVYFRSLSTSKQVNGKTIAGVQLFFNVFPHEDGAIEFPPLDIEVETPDFGGYKGIRHIVKTNPRTINVKPIPANFDADDWLVTSWMSATENWNGDLKNVKVGDVLERNISRNASNTVSELIPPIKWDTIANVSLYPARSSVSNNKTKTSISATRSEGTRYLFENEGTVVIPKMELTWYNPYKNKLYKKTMPEVIINVQPNPDLGMLATVKEQLEKSKTAEESQEEKALTILGLTIKQFLILLAIGLLSLYLSIKLMLLVLKSYKRKRAVYLNSEKYYFDLFIKSIRSKNQQEIQKTLYRWIDMLHLDEPTISNFVKTYGIESMIEDKIINEKEWVLARKKYISRQKNNIKIQNSLWINP